jgi:hypothetical protein
VTIPDSLLPDLISLGVSEAFRNKGIAPTPPRTGTVIAVDTLSRTALVRIDGDTGETQVRLLTEVIIGDRVVIDFSTGGGVWCRGVIGGQGWIAYQTTWAASISPPSIGNGILRSFYRRSGSSCEVSIFLTFGSTSSGGTGNITFSLPFQSAMPVEEAFGFAKIYTAFDGTNFVGWGLIAPGGAVVFVMMPINATDNRTAFMRNADATSLPNTGVPQIAGHYPLENGGNLHIRGSYRVG